MMKYLLIALLFSSCTYNVYVTEKKEPKEVYRNFDDGMFKTLPPISVDRNGQTAEWHNIDPELLQLPKDYTSPTIIQDPNFHKTTLELRPDFNKTIQLTTPMRSEWRDFKKNPITPEEVEAILKPIREAAKRRREQEKWTPEKWANLHRPMDI